MTIRATFFAFVLDACGHSQNKVMTDTPPLPYQAPDIAEITGIEEDEEPTEPEEAPAPAPTPTPAAAPAPAPAPAAAPATKTPAKK